MSRGRVVSWLQSEETRPSLTVVLLRGKASRPGTAQYRKCQRGIGF